MGANKPAWAAAVVRVTSGAAGSSGVSEISGITWQPASNKAEEINKVARNIAVSWLALGA
jgi:hypothetical protein